MPESFFGELLSPWDVEQAAVSTLALWLPEYLAEVERQRGLPNKTIRRPPTPESVHGGVDLDSWSQIELPEVIVVVKTKGPPERHGTGRYAQEYSLDVGCQWRGTGSSLQPKAEEETRMVASYLGAACQLLVQQSNLGGLVEHVVMIGAPDVTFPDPQDKTLAQVVTRYEVWVPQIIGAYSGPVSATPQESPQYGGEPEAPWSLSPTVKTTTEKVKAIPPSEPV